MELLSPISHMGESPIYEIKMTYYIVVNPSLQKVEAFINNGRILYNNAHISINDLYLFHVPSDCVLIRVDKDQFFKLLKDTWLEHAKYIGVWNQTPSRWRQSLKTSLIHLNIKQLINRSHENTTV